MNSGRNLKLIIVLLLVAGAFYLGRNCRNLPGERPPGSAVTSSDSKPASKPGLATGNAIDELTSEGRVVPYVKEHGTLPDYYITKSEARKMGWVASKGNLCDVLPGRAIGGDNFTNREKQLPVKTGRKYYEADLNYNCGNRNADRLVFSNDGLLFVTKDHYKTFQQQ